MDENKNQTLINIAIRRPQLDFKGLRERLNIVNAAVAVALIVAFLAAGLAYHRYQSSAAQLKQSKNVVTPQQQKANQDKIASIVAKVSKLTSLPPGETPALAEINDITKLKNQPFFAKAQNGDEVLIYATAKQAYLYRPSTNLVVNIAPLTGQ